MSDLKEDLGRSRSRSRSPIQRSRSGSNSPRRSRDRQPRQFMGGRKVIIRNIPYEIRWQELKDIIRKEVGDVSYVEMLETPDGKSKGVALVEFKDVELAKKAVEEFHQFTIKDRNITVREERERDRQEFAQSKNMRDLGGMGGGYGGGGMGGYGGGGGGGISPQVLQQLGIDSPITNTVFVANLDYKVTWWKLKDVFKLAGNVMKAEIKEDKDGKSRGMGIVIFEHPVEAVQAVSMFNGQVLFERKMIVRMDKEPGAERSSKLPSGLKSIGMGLGSGGVPITNMGQLGNNLGGLGSNSSLLAGMGSGNSGLGLLGSGDVSMGGGLGLSGLGNAGLGNLSDIGLGRLGNSPKLGGMSDSYSNYNNLAASGFGGGNNLSGLGGLGPNLNSLTGLGSGDRSGLDRLGLGMDRMGDFDRFGGLSDKRDNYGGRDENGRRTTRPDKCTVIVKNLPYSVNWQALKEFFREVADVKFAEIVMEKGRSTGVGYVRFGNENDAQKAINLKHRSKMERRNIDVSIHRD